jgi:hypothetical protein
MRIATSPNRIVDVAEAVPKVTRRNPITKAALDMTCNFGLEGCHATSSMQKITTSNPIRTNHCPHADPNGGMRTNAPINASENAHPIANPKQPAQRALPLTRMTLELNLPQSG